MVRVDDACIGLTNEIEPISLVVDAPHDVVVGDVEVVMRGMALENVAHRGRRGVVVLGTDSLGQDPAEETVVQVVGHDVVHEPKGGVIGADAEQTRVVFVQRQSAVDVVVDGRILLPIDFEGVRARPIGQARKGIGFIVVRYDKTSHRLSQSMDFFCLYQQKNSDILELNQEVCVWLEITFPSVNVRKQSIFSVGGRMP